MDPTDYRPEDQVIARCAQCGRTIYASESFQLIEGSVYCEDDAPADAMTVEEWLSASDETTFAGFQFPGESG